MSSNYEGGKCLSDTDKVTIIIHGDHYGAFWSDSMPYKKFL